MTATLTQPTASWIEDLTSRLFIPTREQLQEVGDVEKPEHLKRLIELAQEATDPGDTEPFALFVVGTGLSASDYEGGPCIAVYKVPPQPEDDNRLSQNPTPHDHRLAIAALLLMKADNGAIGVYCGDSRNLSFRAGDSKLESEEAFELALRMDRLDIGPLTTVVLNDSGSWVELSMWDAVSTHNKNKSDTSDV